MIVLGHRGGRGAGWPTENTLEAFERALGEGAHGVELDVRLCGTREVVVLHDQGLDRVTGGRDTRPVHAVRRAELPRLACGARVPDLAEALDLCHSHVINVELKSDGPDRLALVRAAAREIARSRARDVVVSSFDPTMVVAFRALHRRAPSAILVGPRTPRLGSLLPLALRGLVAAAHLEDALTTDRRVRRLVRSGLRVVSWTVNEPARAEALARLGVSWVITDRPAPVVAAVSGV